MTIKKRNGIDVVLEPGALSAQLLSSIVMCIVTCRSPKNKLHGKTWISVTMQNNVHAEDHEQTAFRTDGNPWTKAMFMVFFATYRCLKGETIALFYHGDCLRAI